MLVVTTGDANDPNIGGMVKFHPSGQWSHRSLGLLISAADDYRHIVLEDDD